MSFGGGRGEGKDLGSAEPCVVDMGTVGLMTPVWEVGPDTSQALSSLALLSSHSLIMDNSYKAIAVRQQLHLYSFNRLTHIPQALHQATPPFSPYIPVGLLPYLAFFLLMATFALAFYFST